jgi:hypothetical protein
MRGARSGVLKRVVTAGPSPPRYAPVQRSRSRNRFRPVSLSLFGGISGRHGERGHYDCHSRDGTETHLSVLGKEGRSTLNDQVPHILSCDFRAANQSSPPTYWRERAKRVLAAKCAARRRSHLSEE